MGSAPVMQAQAPVSKCYHDTLSFAGRGFFVVCQTCQAAWVAIKPGDVPLDTTFIDYDRPKHLDPNVLHDRKSFGAR